MKRPCVWVCLSAIGGILLGVASSVDAISLGVIFTLMAVSWRLSPRYACRILVLGVCFALFFVRVSNEMDLRQSLTPIEMKGAGEVVSRHSGGMTVEVIEPKRWAGRRVTLWADNPLLPGTVIRFSGSFLPLKRAGNPGGRDDLLEGAAREIWFEGDRVRVTETLYRETGIHSRLQAAIDADFPEEIGGLVSALILADRAELELDQQEAIRDLGISHLIAISGFHFVLLLYALRFLLRRMGASPWFSDAAGLLVLWAYGGIIGFPIAALRALVLMSFIVGGEITQLRVDRVNLLFAAAAVLLWLEPFSLFSVGFQLSVIATFSLLVLPKWIQGIVFPRTPVLGKSLAPIFAVQLGILPILIRSFGEVSLMTILGNLIVAPVFVVVMASLFLWAGLAILGASQWFAPLTVFLLKGWISAVCFAASHFLTMVAIRRPSWGMVAGYYLCLGFFYEVSLGRIRLSLSRAKMLFATLVVTLVMGVIVPLPVRFWVLDVGQGDALLLTKGSHGVIWDAGGSPFSDWEVGRSRVEPALDALGIGVLDLGICTHFDADHVEGMVELVEDGRVKRIAMPPCQPDNSWQNKLLAAANNGQCFQIPEKLMLQWDDSICIQVFAPYLHKKENNNSILTRLQVGETVLWLTGDMESGGEKEWLRQMDLDGDILKIAHHGSDSSSTPAFLDAVDPELALISVGKNTYGHPAKAVLERLEERNIDMYRTDRDGALEIRFDVRGYRVIPFRKGRLAFGEWVISHGSILAWLGIFLVLGVGIGIWKTGERV